MDEEIMQRRCKLELANGDYEAYAREFDTYISISRKGLVTVHKPSGKETFQCMLWSESDQQSARKEGV